MREPRMPEAKSCVNGSFRERLPKVVRLTCASNEAALNPYLLIQW